jgi:maleylpyruvate isomerase
VRIALNLKGVAYADAFHHLRKGEQRAPEFLALNPQGLLPALEVDGAMLTQSLAICEYLDETVAGPKLLPADPIRRAKVRAAAQLIACDIHPIQNLKILDRLRGLGLDDAQVSAWAVQVIEEGLDAFDKLIAAEEGPLCFGHQVTLADISMVGQLVNAWRVGSASICPGRVWSRWSRRALGWKPSPRPRRRTSPTPNGMVKGSAAGWSDRVDLKRGGAAEQFQQQRLTFLRPDRGFEMDAATGPGQQFDQPPAGQFGADHGFGQHRRARSVADNFDHGADIVAAIDRSIGDCPVTEQLDRCGVDRRMVG